MEISIRVKEKLTPDFLKKLDDFSGYSPFLDWEDEDEFNYYIGTPWGEDEEDVDPEQFEHLENVLAWIHANLPEGILWALGFDEWGTWANSEHYRSEKFQYKLKQYQNA